MSNTLMVRYDHEIKVDLVFSDAFRVRDDCFRVLVV